VFLLLLRHAEINHAQYHEDKRLQGNDEDVKDGPY
jgi:hypothetical protein